MFRISIKIEDLEGIEHPKEVTFDPVESWEMEESRGWVNEANEAGMTAQTKGTGKKRALLKMWSGSLNFPEETDLNEFD